jgi:nitrous oxidase accessory protein
MKTASNLHRATMPVLSRVLLGIAALLLAVAFVVPVWRISLIAPQYPEGLGMLIRVNTITGIKPADLDNINGLNHYIGMKTIVPDAIPVLDVMPVALGVLVAIGLLSALYGRRWAGWAWLGLIAAGGTAAMYEFWKWSYDYGHNLAPDAIIKVPGMTYQPPLIGTKQLLNFTAASWPAAGAIAAALAFVVALAALLLAYRKRSAASGLNTPAISMAAAVLTALILVPSRADAQLGSVVVSPGGTSLSDAIRSVRAGGRVIIKPGHYRVRDLLIQKPVTIVGEGFPTLDAEGKGEILRIAADDVTVSGLRLINTGVSYTQDRAAIRVTEVGSCRIIGNRIENILYGIYLAKVTSCLVADNVLSATGKTEATSGNGIHLWSSREIRIDNNQVRRFRDGIYFEFVHDTKVTRNVSEGNLRYGLHFMYSDDCEYLANVFRQNGAGVAVMYTKRVHMSGNRFEKNWGSSAYGLLLKEIVDSRIERNVFDENTVGLYADGADRIQATGNEFSRNGWAVKVGGSTLNGRFTRNNFESNTFDITTNSQNPSTTFEGNFWSAYRGYDLDRDGVGDVPHPPVRLFALVVERSPQAIVLMRSALAALLDAAERAMPSLTPAILVDPKPSMRRLG